MSQSNAQVDCLVDKLIEDEVEREGLLAKPTCFIIVGRPGVGKSTLAKHISESWKCILIDDTDLLNTHLKNKTKEGIELSNILFEGRSVPEDMVLQLILARLKSPDVEHYGYVLSCLPFMSEECLKIHEQLELIKNLELIPDFIINIKCADQDLIHRLSDLKQNTETGQLYTNEQWLREQVLNSYRENKDEEVEGEEELEEQEPQKKIVGHLVWTPENLARNALPRINMYKETMLRPLEDYMTGHNPCYRMELDGNNPPEELHSCVMTRLGSMAVKRVSIPFPLYQIDDEELPEDIETEDVLRIMSSSGTVAPGFRWRRSRWGQTCPVALKEGKIILGKPELSVGFQDKLYILSSQEAYEKFVTNPRRYLLPPMPRAPCRVCIIGPPQAGKSTLCKLLAQHYNALVFDMEVLVQPDLAKVEQERLDKIKEETTQMAIEKIKMTMEPEAEAEADGGENLVTEDHPEVQAIVLSALEEAKHMSTSPSLYDEALQKRIKEIEEVEADAGWVLDNFPKNSSQMDTLQQAGILPEIIFCLRDSDGNKVLKRLYEINKDSVDNAMRKKLQDEQSEEKQALNQKESESEVEANPAELQTNLETVVEETEENPNQSDTTSPANPAIVKEKDSSSPSTFPVAQDVVLPDHWDLGYPDRPEMNDYVLQLRQFVSEWGKMQSALTVGHSVLDIADKSPEDLLLEMLLIMQKPFEHVSWELSAMDLDQEAEDMRDLTEMERFEEGSTDNDAAEEEDEGDTTVERLLGDTYHFCPVALKKHNVLWPCTDEIAVKYREKTFYFSSPGARDSFLQNPVQYVAQTEPLKPPVLRIFLLGTRGSGKTTHGAWLAQQFGIFHIQFREQLQMLIMTKTKKRVHSADEAESSEDAEHLESEIEEARLVFEKETEGMVETEQMNGIEEVDLTDEEKAIQAYLSEGDPLTPEILDAVVAPYWKKEPFISTGFIMEGFPQNPEEVQYMLRKHLFPDAVVTMVVDVTDVQKRLLPTYLERWHERCNHREERLSLLRSLREKNKEENIAIRRAELIMSAKEKRKYQDDEEDDEDASNIEDGIEAVLQEEFPIEEDNEDIEYRETVRSASERLEMEIAERYLMDENNLSIVMEHLSEVNITKVLIRASHKLHIVRYRLLQKIQPLMTNRESLFQRCQPISCSLAHKLLLFSYKLHSAFGCWDPIQQYNERDVFQPLQWPLNNTYPIIFHQYIYFFASEENRNTFMLNPLKYLRQPKPTPSLPVKIAVVGPPKSGKTTVAQKFAREYGVACLSIGSVMRTVLSNHEHTDLAVQMKEHLYQGLTVPDELAIQCLEVVLMSSVCSNQGYVLDGFPKTLKQSELIGSCSIIPMIVVELELNTVEVLRRGFLDNIQPNKPHLTHDSSKILHIRNACYKHEIENVRQHFQQDYQNWIRLDGFKSKWWIGNHIMKELSISMRYISNYLGRVGSRKAACINRLCITPKELQCRLGEFSHYCPVCLALHHHLVDCSETAALTHAAEYKGHYYKMCGQDHLERFLATPDDFVSPGCAHTLPQPHLLPRKITEDQVKKRFPRQVEMRGFCPVTYVDGKQRYEALVQGKMEYAVEYRERIYIFETEQKRDKFLRTPEAYWDQKLPIKVPPLMEPTPLTSLPTLGYLEQGVSVSVIKAMTAVGCLKPKHPFLSIQTSSLLYVAFYLKAFNHKSTDFTRKKYKKKVASFEENCALIPYLSSTMRGSYRSPSERPIDFEFKLNRFLALGDSPVADSVL